MCPPYAFQNQIKLFLAFEMFWKMCFSRVQMEETVLVTGGKLTLDASLIQPVNFILKIKGTISGLRQFWAIESTLKMMENAFHFP